MTVAQMDNSILRRFPVTIVRISANSLCAIALSVLASSAGAAPTALAAEQHSSSPAMRMINFYVTTEGPQTFTVKKGGTFSNCGRYRKITSIKARGTASGMSSKMIVTGTWYRNGAIILKKTARWGTPPNGLFGSTSARLPG